MSNCTDFFTNLRAMEIKLENATSFEFNVLPCQIKYNGYIRDFFGSRHKYWKVHKEGDKLVSFFRGRKLKATPLNLGDKEFSGYVVMKNEDEYTSVGQFEIMNEFCNGEEEGEDLVAEWLEVANLINS